MKPLRLAALAALVSLAACTSSPTQSAQPAGPSFDGGNMLGTGNYVAEEGEGQGLAGDTTVVTERGGNGLGSGN